MANDGWQYVSNSGVSSGSFGGYAGGGHLGGTPNQYPGTITTPNYTYTFGCNCSKELVEIKNELKAIRKLLKLSANYEKLKALLEGIDGPEADS